MEKTRILIAEDDESLVTYLESLLAEMGYQVSGWEAAGQAAILAAQEQQPDLTLMDIHLRGEMSGIHAEDLSKLFKSFVQLDSSLSRQHSGTGLGLALVQKMAELQGGSVEVESAPGTGSRFTIILPWSKREIELNGARGGIISPQSVVLWPQENRLKPPGSFSWFLVADDNENTLERLSNFLETRQYRVISTRSGSELLQRAPELHPDLMLVDIQMPGMEGLETIRRLRAHPQALLAKTPVIAITALAMPGDRERCLSVGANAYLSKPLKLVQLISLLDEILHPAEG